MVYVLYTYVKNQLNADSFATLYEQLPVNCQYRINRFVQQQDAQRSLLGLSLLTKGLKVVVGASASLASLVYLPNGKPVLSYPLHFSITHAGGFSVCAISTTATVGIDIEQIVDRPLEDFESQFTKAEWQQIVQNNTSLKQFYTGWTKKEALVKATGEGLTANLSLINTTADIIYWQQKEWYWTPVPLHSNYVSFLAADSGQTQLSLKEYFFE